MINLLSILFYFIFCVKVNPMDAWIINLKRRLSCRLVFVFMEGRLRSRGCCFSGELWLLIGFLKREGEDGAKEPSKSNGSEQYIQFKRSCSIFQRITKERVISESKQNVIRVVVLAVSGWKCDCSQLFDSKKIQIYLEKVSSELCWGKNTIQAVKFLAKP